MCGIVFDKGLMGLMIQHNIGVLAKEFFLRERKLMKILNMNCPNCNGQMSIDIENKKATCEHCGTVVLIDDEVQHLQYDNAEDAGYNFEKGRMKAWEEKERQENEARQREYLQREAARQQELERRKALREQQKKKPNIALIVTLSIMGTVIIVLLICCGGCALLSSKVNNGQANTVVLSEENEILSENEPENLPESVDITTPVGNILWPKETGQNEIMYVCHGSYDEPKEPEEPFVDEDGEVFDKYYKMYYHNAWTDGVYIDLTAESYNTLSFKAEMSHYMYNDSSVLKIQVFDKDTNELLYETEQLVLDHITYATVDITGHTNIRLNVIDENNRACYCGIKEIVLSDLSR